MIHLLLATATLCSGLSPAAMMTAAGTGESMHDLAMQEQWKALHSADAKKGFSPQRLFAPLPAAWPPDGKGTVLIYAYSQKISPNLRDGARLGAPWGYWSQTGSDAASARFEVLPGPSKDLGIQGVRPLNASEAAVLSKADAVAARLTALSQSTGAPVAPTAADEELRSFYRLWQRLNATLAEALEPRHRAFFAWIMNTELPGIEGKTFRIVRAKKNPATAGTWTPDGEAFIAVEQNGDAFTLQSGRKTVLGAFVAKGAADASATIGTVAAGGDRISWSDGSTWRLAVAPRKAPKLSAWWTEGTTVHNLQSNGVIIGDLVGNGIRTAYFISATQLYATWSNQVGTLSADATEIAWANGEVWHVRK